MLSRACLVRVRVVARVRVRFRVSVGVRVRAGEACIRPDADGAVKKRGARECGETQPYVTARTW